MSLSTLPLFTSSLFRILRDSAAREGKCGRCEYTKICGGSRARAWALTGNYLAEDPRCIYQPAPRPARHETPEQEPVGAH